MTETELSGVSCPLCGALPCDQVNSEAVAAWATPSADRAEEIARLRERLNHINRSSALPLGSWIDISSAPKDALILGFGLLEPHPDSRHLYSGLDRPMRCAIYWDEIDDAWCPAGATWLGPWFKPTAWQPLPVAPIASPPEAGR